MIKSQENKTFKIRTDRKTVVTKTAESEAARIKKTAHINSIRGKETGLDFTIKLNRQIEAMDLPRPAKNKA